MGDQRRSSGQANEGEGNKTAARHYNEAQAGFAKSSKVADKAREAREAIDAPEGKELARAEAEGKSHSAGEDPALKR
jgi:hypothetical protein